jgi:serine/threonine protein kinase/formylglycine-generating enzyme required for sulfatase activity/Leucine-rich repeat (LRR) protein
VADPAGLNVQKFIELLESVRILVPEDLVAIKPAWEGDRASADAGALARELVQQGKLTKHQAAALYQNRPKAVALGPYVLLDRLGSGGMGTVYKGRHRQTQKIVAVKVLNASAVRSADSVRRFQREAETAARLKHPNLVRAFEAGEVDGQHVFVMEFVEGIDLSSFVKKNGPLPLGQAVHCIVQAARALAYAHEQGVVHRDIKPANLMLGADGHVKVLDMGLARFSDPAATASNQADEGLTQTGQVMGTLDYMAPEQALHTRLADARADVYSLGCSFYKIATGVNAFDGDSLVAKILAHREQPIPSLKATNPAIPQATDLVLQKMLAKNPDHRYQTMTELADELERSLKVPDGAPAEFRVAPVAVAAKVVQAAAVDQPSTSLNLNVRVGGGSSSKIEPRVKRKASGSPKLVLGGIGALVVAVAAAAFVLKDQIFPPTQEPEVVKLVPRAAPPTPSATGNPTPSATASGTTTNTFALALTTASSTTTQSNSSSSTGPRVSISVNSPASSGTNDGLPRRLTLTGSVTASSTSTGGQIPSTTTTGNVSTGNTTPVATSTSSVTSSINSSTMAPNTTSPTTLATTSSTTSTTAGPSPSTEAVAEKSDPRAEVPPTPEVETALKLIRGDLFKDDYAKAKKPDERAALGKMLFTRGMGLAEDPVGRFVMLREARDLAAEGGDTATVDAIVAGAASLYKVEPLEWLLGAYEPVVKKTLPGPIARQIATALLPKIDAAVADEEFEVAERIMTTSVAAARKAQDAATLKTVTDRNKRFDKEKQLREALARAKKSLEANPDDPAANLTLGRHLCFEDGEWAAGFECLAKGSDVGLKDLAAESLKAPTEPDAIVALGDLWWAKSEKTSAVAAKREFQAGAVYWYEQVAAKASGLVKTKVEKRIADARAAGANVVSKNSGKGIYLRVPLSPTVSMAMRFIPAGSFMMGSPPNEPGRSVEEVPHRVTITKPFFLAVTEMTQEQWTAVMRGDYKAFSDDPQWPIDGVSTVGVNSLLPRLNNGPYAAFLRFRLPTEAEWEYAARAGTMTAFPWGDNFDQIGNYAVVNSGGLSRVASRRPNAWGLYDMIGNVAEACSDYYSSATYTPAAVFDPKGPPSATMGSSSIVHRGGHFVSSPTFWRSAARGKRGWGVRTTYVGFRLACDVLGEVPPAMFFSDAAQAAAAPSGLPSTPTFGLPSTGNVSPSPTAPPASPATAPSAPATTMQAAAQSLADWAFKRGGSFLYTVPTSGGFNSFSTSRPSDMPTTPITPRGVGFYSSSAGQQLTPADIQFLGTMPWIKDLHLSYTQVDDVAPLTNIVSLERLTLSYNRRLNDAKLAPFGKLPELQSFFANETGINGAMFAQPGAFSKLTALYLNGNTLTDQGVAGIGRLTQLKSLSLDRTGLTDGQLSQLRDLTALTYLSLGGTRVTSAGLAAISQMSSLATLRLSDCTLSGAGLSALQNARELNYLYLERTQLNDAALQPLATCTGLDAVYLEGCNVTGTGVAAAFASCQSLQNLNLLRTRIGDADVGQLARLSAVRVLYLDETQVGDAGMAKLAAAENLTSLHLQGTRVTDASITAFKQFRSLRSLYVSRTQISPAGVQALKAAMPQCRVYNGHGISP